MSMVKEVMLKLGVTEAHVANEEVFKAVYTALRKDPETIREFEEFPDGSFWGSGKTLIRGHPEVHFSRIPQQGDGLWAGEVASISHIWLK